MFYTIRLSDVGKPSIKAWKQSWLVSNFIGRIMTQDVGKRVYKVGRILQVENQEQMEARLNSGRVL